MMNLYNLYRFIRSLWWICINLQIHHNVFFHVAQHFTYFLKKKYVMLTKSRYILYCLEQYYMFFCNTNIQFRNHSYMIHTSVLYTSLIVYWAITALLSLCCMLNTQCCRTLHAMFKAFVVTIHTIYRTSTRSSRCTWWFIILLVQHSMNTHCSSLTCLPSS